jgi:hypothetical protein
MAVVLKAKRVAGVATLTLDSVSGLVAGQQVVVYNVTNQLDGFHNLLTVTGGTTNEVTYPSGGQNIAEFNVANGLLFTEVTWASVEDVENFIGYEPDAQTSDADYLDQCVRAANCFAYRRRKNAGYKDNPTAPSCESSKLATILLAGALFRQKGSVDGFQSYQDMSITAATGNYGEVMKLLGVNRAQVG